jgi:hypothetical protein
VNTVRARQWERLTAPTPAVGMFDPDDTADLPAPARRLLRHALRPGVPLASTVVLEMTGEIRLRRWLPFEARQVLRAGKGFMWAPRVGRPPVTFTGTDARVDGRGTLDFRLWGVLPVARASGPDTDRSTAGRVAAETVIWLPQALTPAMGATWTGLDHQRAVVSVPVDRTSVDVTVTVDEDGLLRELTLLRWGSPDDRPAAAYPFGGDVQEERVVDGVTIASRGRAGWWWGTPDHDEGVFFRYQITAAQFRVATPVRQL